MLSHDLGRRLVRDRPAGVRAHHPHVRQRVKVRDDERAHRRDHFRAAEDGGGGGDGGRSSRLGVGLVVRVSCSVLRTSRSRGSGGGGDRDRADVLLHPRACGRGTLLRWRRRQCRLGRDPWREGPCARKLHKVARWLGCGYEVERLFLII